MNKMVWLGIGAVVIVGAGIIGFLAMSWRVRPEQTMTSTSVQEQSSMEGERKTLRDLWSLGVNQMCTFQDEQGNSGTVYIGQNQVRGDFAVTVEEKLTNSHLIVKAETAYVWMEGLANGYKFPLGMLTGTENQTNVPKTMDVNEQVDYECNPWTLETSRFDLPTGVEFVDSEAIMPQVTYPEGSGNAMPDLSSQCAACENLTGAARDQCRTALACN